MRFLKEQKNQLYSIIAENGLSPLQFAIEESFNDPSTIRYVNNNDYLFEIDGWTVRFNPGTYSFSEHHSWYGTWENLSHLFYIWIRNLVNELEVVDKWELLQKLVEAFSLNDATGDERFTQEESQPVKTSVDLLKEKLLQQSPELQVHIDQRFDTLTQKIDELSKREWIKYYIQTIMGLAIDFYFNPEHSAMFWNTIKTAFTNDPALLP